MGKIIHKANIYGAWQDEKEEAWLQEMAGQGFHLVEVGFPFMYGFEKGEPRQMVYRLDFTSLRKADRDSYFQLFRDSGWEWVGEMTSWQYFRKPVEEGETAEIFTDTHSKAEKYRRVLLLLVVLMPSYFLVFRMAGQENLFLQILIVLMIPMMIVYLYAILKLMGRIKDLEKGS